MDDTPPPAVAQPEPTPAPTPQVNNPPPAVTPTDGGSRHEVDDASMQQLQSLPDNQLSLKNNKAILYDRSGTDPNGWQRIVPDALAWSKQQLDPQKARDQFAAESGMSIMLGIPASTIAKNPDQYQNQVEGAMGWDHAANVGAFAQNLSDHFKTQDAQTEAIKNLQAKTYQSFVSMGQQGSSPSPLAAYAEFSKDPAFANTPEAQKLQIFQSAWKPLQDSLASPEGVKALQLVNALTKNKDAEGIPEERADQISAAAEQGKEVLEIPTGSKQSSMQPNPNDPSWRREDGSLKGRGFLGLIQRPDGNVSSEISIGIEDPRINGGKETDIPSMVPTLSQKELSYLLTTPEEEIGKADPSLFSSIKDKAVAFAAQRTKDGKPVFAQDGESQQLGQQPTKIDPVQFIKGLPEAQQDKVLSIAAQVMQSQQPDMSNGMKVAGGLAQAFAQGFDSYSPIFHLDDLVEAEKQRANATTPEDAQKAQDQIDNLKLMQKVKDAETQANTVSPTLYGLPKLAYGTTQDVARMPGVLAPALVPVLGEFAFYKQAQAEDALKLMSQNPSMSATEAKDRTTIASAAYGITMGRLGAIFGEAAPGLKGFLIHTAQGTAVMQGAEGERILGRQLQSQIDPSFNPDEKYSQEWLDLLKSIPSTFVTLAAFGGMVKLINKGDASNIDKSSAEEIEKQASNPRLLQYLGFSSETANAIANLPEGKRLKDLAGQWDNRTDEMKQAGVQLAKDDSAKAEEVLSHPDTPKISTTPDGKYVVTAKDGEKTQSVPFDTQEGAQAAYTMAMEHHIELSSEPEEESHPWTSVTDEKLDKGAHGESTTEAQPVTTEEPKPEETLPDEMLQQAELPWKEKEKQKGVLQDFLDNRATSESGFVDLSPIADKIAEYGKAIYEKGMTFADWSKRMISDLGDKVKDILGKVWNSYKNSRFSSEVGAIDAWHGTPHDVDRFSTEKIGTGEGAQAYGHGLYFAENPEVAKMYRDALSRGSKVMVDGIPSVGEKVLAKIDSLLKDGKITNQESHGFKDIYSRSSSTNSVEQAIKEYESSERWKAHRKPIAEKFRKLLKPIEDGNLYSVSIDAEPHEILDWDKPLSEQSPHIKEALAKLPKEVFDEINERLEQHGLSPLKENPLDDSAFSGADLYRGIAKAESRPAHPEEYNREVRADEATSHALASVGIKGIRYLDQGSRQDGNGTHNIVVFDDRHVTITERNGQKVTVEQFASDIKDALARRANSESGGIDPSVLEDIKQYGSLMLGKAKDFASWSKLMIEKLGNGVKSVLKQVWEGYKSSRFSSESGSLGSASDDFAKKVDARTKSLGATPEDDHISRVEESKNFFKSLGNHIASLPKDTPFMKALLDYHSKQQISTHQVKRAMKDISDVAKTPTQREAIFNYIEAYGDRAKLKRQADATEDKKLKAGYQEAANLSPEMVKIADDVSKAFKTVLGRLRKEGYDVGERPNYAGSHEYKKNPGDKAPFTSKRLDDNFRYSERREFNTAFDAEQAGYNLRTKDAAELLGKYLHHANDVILQRRFVSSLFNQDARAEDGRTLISPRGGIGQKPTPEAKGMFIDPERAQIGTADYESLNQPALKGYHFIDNKRNLALRGEFAVHPDIASHLDNIFRTSKLKQAYNDQSLNPAVKAGVKAIQGLDIAGQYAKATLYSGISFFHQGHEAFNALFHGINPIFHTGSPDPENDPIAKDAVQHGVQLLPDRMTQDQFKQEIGEASKSLLTMGLRKTGLNPLSATADLLDSYSHYLFENYIPNLKLKVYQAAIERNMKLYSDDLKAGKVTEAQIKMQSAYQANEFAGHQNLTLLGRNPTAQHLASICFGAPDFLEAQARFQGHAIAGLTGAKSNREFLQAAALQAITMFVGSRLINYLINGDLDLDHPFEIRVGDRYYGIRSRTGDTFNLAKDMAENGIPTTFLSGRISPLVGKFILEAGSHKNYRGEHVGFGGIVADTLAGIAPIATQPLIRQWTTTGKNTPVSPFEQMLSNVLGFQIHRYSPITNMYPITKSWMKENYPEKVNNDVHPTGKYTALKYALEDADTDKAHEEIENLKKEGYTDDKIAKGIKESINHSFTDSKTHDEEMAHSLTGENLKTYEAAIERRKTIMQRFNALHSP